ncbi:hypothetical protein M406DRAFT_328326 [Cryphonectria parasitica EP155]|uniref:Uncharacterized protein n=1 Tax=Cryphonectria parasitica (strain ATCC 38755 / EP155) TaxID=660469 RepID=A0A9P4Y6Y3_CRYP1|nr:uncharacterized protein M406DRAFT_328326 [Cryphonectria parasitica EP155]KAF3767235.1 hypothetical protein M406DRAFT_328326 [Cryphonectria parasitica EP155]
MQSLNTAGNLAEPVWWTPAINFVETSLGPDGDPMEKRVTVHRIHFSKQPGLRHLGMWDGAKAYRAVATWMLTVGSDRYIQYTRNVNSPINQPVHQLKYSGAPAVQHHTASISHSVPQQAGLVNYDAEVTQIMTLKGQHWRGFITTYNQYQNYKTAYYRQNNDERAVEQIPNDNPRILNAVRTLYAAILDVNDLIENPRLKIQCKSLKRTITDRETEAQQDKFTDCVAVARTKQLNSLEVELLCWEIVEEAWYGQQGQFCIPPWYDNPKPGKSKKPARFHSFEHRIQKCEEALRSSKNIVKMMLGISFTKRLAYNPSAERKIDNKKVNSRRDEENKAGRESSNWDSQESI